MSSIDPTPSSAGTFDPAARLRPVDVTLSTASYLRALWSRRDFAVAMPAESIRAEHQDTLLGNVWHLGNPMLSIAVYYLVFGSLLGVDRGIDNYLLWLTVGVFAFRLTQSSVLGGARSITSNVGLMRALRFPRALLPMSVVIGQILTFGFELAAVAGVAILTGEGLSRRLLALPLIMLVHSMLNLGGAFIAARLTDSFRDMQQVIPFLFTLLRYLSGVMYPVDRYAESTDHIWVHRIVVWNPLVRILDLYRWAFLGSPLEPLEVAQTIVMSALVLVVGFRYFVAAEHQYGRP
jgi:teichoic acid transport system permease protein